MFERAVSGRPGRGPRNGRVWDGDVRARSRRWFNAGVPDDEIPGLQRGLRRNPGRGRARKPPSVRNRRPRRAGLSGADGASTTQHLGVPGGAARRFEGRRWPLEGSGHLVGVAFAALPLPVAVAAGDGRGSDLAEHRCAGERVPPTGWRSRRGTVCSGELDRAEQRIWPASRRWLGRGRVGFGSAFLDSRTCLERADELQLQELARTAGLRSRHYSSADAPCRTSGGSLRGSGRALRPGPASRRDRRIEVLVG